MYSTLPYVNEVVNSELLLLDCVCVCVRACMCMYSAFPYLNGEVTARSDVFLIIIDYVLCVPVVKM